MSPKPRTKYHLLKKTKRSAKAGYVYHVAYLNPTGNPKYSVIRSTNVSNKSRAREIAEQWLDEGITMPDGELDYLAQVWTPESAYVKSRLARGRSMSATYIAINNSWIKRYFLPYCKDRGVKSLSEIDTAFVERWVIQLWEKKSISPTTVNKVLQAVKVAFGQAARDGLIKANPAREVEPVAEEEQERGIFTLEQYAKMFAEPWSDIRAYAACYLSATTGMRLGEVRGLQVKAIDLEAATVDVLTSWQDNEGIKPPKWNSYRKDVPIPPGALRALQDVLRLHKWGAEEEQFVFFDVESPDRPMRKEAIMKGLYDKLEELKIDRKALKLSFHSFRHTIITTLKDELGDGLRFFIGHKQERTTERYIHQTPEEAKKYKKALTSRFSFAG